MTSAAMVPTTRVNHVVSGSDYGWRNGTGKWPEWYIDSVPAAVNIGPGWCSLRLWSQVPGQVPKSPLYSRLELGQDLRNPSRTKGL